MIKPEIIDENTIKIDGKVCKAIEVKDKYWFACKNCILNNIDCVGIPCYRDERKDYKNVIFVESKDR